MSGQLTKYDETIMEFCSINALVAQSTGTHYPADGFCYRCIERHGKEWNYQHDGVTTGYIRQAVLEKLKRDGIKVAEGFDEKTGREILDRTAGPDIALAGKRP